jgi:hypothetical protein
MRQIYIVSASVVDANGTFNFLNGYPKTFDSRSYGGNVDKTLQRAMGDFSDAFGSMCKVDSRQLQTVTLMTVDGFLIDSKHLGSLADPVQEETG